MSIRTYFQPGKRGDYRCTASHFAGSHTGRQFFTVDVQDSEGNSAVFYFDSHQQAAELAERFTRAIAAANLEKTLDEALEAVKREPADLTLALEANPVPIGNPPRLEDSAYPPSPWKQPNSFHLEE